MAQYKIIIDKEDLHQLFNQDQGMTRLVEKVLNKILEGVVHDNFRALFAVVLDKLPADALHHGYQEQTSTS